MHRRWFRIGLGSVSALLIVAALWLRASPERVERLFSDAVGPHVVRLLSTLTALLPFSVTELLAVGLVLAALGSALAGLHRLRRGRRSLRETALGALGNLLLALLLLAASFYWTWGLNYYRPALPERVAWTPRATSPAEDELGRLSEELVRLANQEYLATLFRPAPDRRSIDDELEQAFQRVAGALDLPAERFGRAKPLWSSTWLARLGIAGFYTPWTGEAGFNDLVPAIELAHVLAHEKAHQRGIAAEDEAGFAGFVACLAAEDPSIRYSGLLFAQTQLLDELFLRDGVLAARLAGERLPGVREDLEQAEEQWRRFRGPLRRVGAALNDSYLRLQGVEDGFLSYDRSTRLIVLYGRAHGGGFPIGP